MRLNILLFLFAFCVKPVVAQDLEQLFGSKEIVVFTFNIKTMDMRPHFLDSALKSRLWANNIKLPDQDTRTTVDIPVISAVRIDVTTGKVVGIYEQKTTCDAFNLFLKTYYPYMSDHFEVCQNHSILKEGIPVLEGLAQLEKFAENAPFYCPDFRDDKACEYILTDIKKASKNDDIKLPFSKPFNGIKELLSTWGQNFDAKKIDKIPEMIGKSDEKICEELGITPEPNERPIRKYTRWLAALLLDAARKKVG